MLKNIIRALRLPFVSASILPFIFGSLIERQHFNFRGFFLGLIAVAATHLSANLINDYADSRTGVDWQDKSFYGFFGGSKLIQEGIFSEKFYLGLAIFFAAISAFSVVILALILSTASVIVFYLFIIFLSWLYSVKPLQFSYHRIGEFIIFLLFGPALVMGGYFIQTKIFPDMRSFILSLPFGFLTTAILFANEVPDFTQDKEIGKFTWVGFLGPRRAFLLYTLLMVFAFFLIFLNIALGYLGFFAFFSFALIFPVMKAANILRIYPEDKIRLMESSKLTIAAQTFVSLILIADIFK